MKNKFVLAIAIVAIVTGAVIAAQAFGGHNSKSAFAGSITEVSHSTPDGAPTTVSLGDATVKVSQKTDVVISLTAVSSLFTDTTVKGNNAGSSVSESSTAGITVWANVTPLDNVGNTAGDSKMAFPGQVVLNKRIQTMSGKLSNVLTCVNATTGALEACGGAEEIELKLNTTSANGFNFLATDLEQGNYLIEVFAELDTNLLTVDQVTSSSDPIAVIGKRTIVVWEVKNPSTIV